MGEAGELVSGHSTSKSTLLVSVPEVVIWVSSKRVIVNEKVSVSSKRVAPSTLDAVEMTVVALDENGFPVLPSALRISQTPLLAAAQTPT